MPNSWDISIQTKLCNILYIFRVAEIDALQRVTLVPLKENATALKKKVPYDQLQPYKTSELHIGDNMTKQESDNKTDLDSDHDNETDLDNDGDNKTNPHSDNDNETDLVSGNDNKTDLDNDGDNKTNPHSDITATKLILRVTTMVTTKWTWAVTTPTLAATTNPTLARARRL